MSPDEKLKLEYPCTWIYKIIGSDVIAMQKAVEEIISDRTCKISPSRSSRTAKYHCLNVELSIESESQRITLYETLKSHPAIKIVL